MAKKNFRSKKNWWVSRREHIIFLLFFSIIFILHPKKGLSIEEGSVAGISEFSSSVTQPIPTPKPAPYPININQKNPPREISAHAVIVIDAKSGVAMYKKNELEPLSPASTTKIMTALVALDTYKLSDIITFDTATISGQLMDLVPGEQISVENLLYGALIQSGNDAAYAIAAHHPNGFGGFVEEMNKKAKELNLNQTHFTNPIGYDDPNQKMSAKDLARLGRIAMENSFIVKAVSIPQITISDATYTIFHDLKNVNQLLGKVPGVSGIKTGWTEEAGENLVTMVERDGHKVIIVTLRSQDRFEDTLSLINWVFANHEWVQYGFE